MGKPPESTLQEWNRLAAEEDGWFQEHKQGDTRYWGSPPNYAHDLNDMHRLEMGLESTGQKFEYIRILEETVQYSGISLKWDLVTAPAWVRLRAWLEVRGVEVRDAE